MIPLRERKGKRNRVIGLIRAGGARKNRESMMVIFRRVDCLHFIEALYRRRFPKVVAKLLGAAYRPSSLCQVKVAWKAFKSVTVYG